MAKDKTEEFQKQARELLRAQQEAYLEAVKAWREAAADMPAPQWPTPPEWPGAAQLDTLPRPSEVAEASYAFAASLLADQSRFIAELSKAMAPKKEKP